MSETCPECDQHETTRRHEQGRRHVVLPRVRARAASSSTTWRSELIHLGASGSRPRWTALPGQDQRAGNDGSALSGSPVCLLCLPSMLDQYIREAEPIES